MTGARRFYNMCYIEFLLNSALIWKHKVISNKTIHVCNNLELINFFKVTALLSLMKDKSLWF